MQAFNVLLAYSILGKEQEQLVIVSNVPKDTCAQLLVLPHHILVLLNAQQVSTALELKFQKINYPVQLGITVKRVFHSQVLVMQAPIEQQKRLQDRQIALLVMLITIAPNKV